jgi:hypothetical protein
MDGEALMDDSRFWSIIEAGGKKAISDPEPQITAVRKELTKLTPEELREFQHLYNEKLAHAYTWDLWGAAYLINGGCSDDGFHYFRSWLISRGRAAYEAALENPDTLAGLTDPDRDDYEFEELAYVPLEVYEELTGKEMTTIELRWPENPRGAEWDFDNDEQITKRLPKLAKIYLD